MKNNTINIRQNTPKFLFWAVCFILILPIIILPPTFQPSDWSRTILFKSSVAILVSFLLYKYFYKNEISVSLPKWNFSDYLPFLLLSAYMLSVAISVIFSQDMRFSFFSSPARASGFLNLLFYYIFAIILALFVKGIDWHKLWTVNFIAAVLASFLAIIQSFNLLKSVFTSYEGGGVPSFLGNSTFLAVYMFFMAVWSFVVLLQKKERKQKMFYGGLFCLFVLTIFLTGSRATYLALIASSFFFFFFYPFNVKRIKTLKLIAGSLVLLAIVIILIFNFFPQIGKINSIFSRLENRLSLQRAATDLFGTRFAVWQIAIKAIKDKPLFGWGPENFYIGFEKYYNPTVANMQKLWWDRPHNIFLDVAVNYGLIALFFYISFWVVLLLSLQKLKKTQTDEQKICYAHALQAMFIGYLIILFFNFDNFSIYLILFFLIGFSFYLISLQKEFFEIKNSQKIINYKNKKAFAAGFAIIILFFIYFWNIKPLFLNESVSYAVSMSSIGKCEKAMSTMEAANKNPGILLTYNALIYSDVIKKCSSAEKEIEYAKKGLDALKKAAITQPTWSRTWLFMGGLEDVLAAREQDQNNKDKLLKEAKNYLNQALKISPKRIEILVEMEKNYLVAQDYQAMKKIAGDCIAMDPSQGICYWYMGIPEIFLGDQVNGKKHIQQALDKGGFSPQYIQLGSAYISQKNYKDASLAYHQLTANYPDNPNYHAVMAFLSRQIGDFDRASSEALQVFKLQPDNEESVQFLQALLGLNPNSPVVHTSMAFVYKELGKTEEYNREINKAINIYTQLINANPKVPDYHYELAKIYADQENYEKAYQESLLTIKIAGPTDLKTKTEIEDFMINTLPTDIWNRYFNGQR